MPHQHVCSVSMHVPCGACSAFTKSTVSIRFQVRPGLLYSNMIFLNMYHLNCTLHCVHFIALSHEAKSEWYRTQLAKFCGGRGICTDVTSGAEKFTLGSRIHLRGTGYFWPGLFSGLWKFAGAQSLQYVYMDDDIIINYYIIMISF